MNPTILLRIASVVASLQFLAHTFMHVRGRPTHGPEEIAVVEAMKSHYFDFMGFARSYWDFYFGYGLFAAFNCLVEAVLFWQLASLAQESPLHVGPIAALFFVANIGYVVLALRYFFITPVVPDIAIAICLGLTFMLIRSGNA